MKYCNHLFIIALFLCQPIHAMESSGITIDQITIENMHERTRDLNDIRQLMLRTYLPYTQQDARNTHESAEKLIEWHYSNEIKDIMNATAHTQLYVAKHKQEIIGFVTWSISLKDNGIFLHNLAVDENYRYQGIGRKLALLPFEEVYDTKRITTCPDLVYQNAVEFFKRIGFKEDPKYKDFTTIYNVYLTKQKDK